MSNPMEVKVEDKIAPEVEYQYKQWLIEYIDNYRHASKVLKTNASGLTVTDRQALFGALPMVVLWRMLMPMSAGELEEAKRGRGRPPKEVKKD